MEFDVFISHASEDKDKIVRPLANTLKKLGVKVWYDEFSLKLGDSLSKSIDIGLAKSKYGVVVISKMFLQKPWPDYELQSLVSKEVGSEKVILPIWHGVDRGDVIKRSPYLADKFSIKTNGTDLEQLIAPILEVIRPDIHENLSRHLLWKKIKEKANLVRIQTKDVKKGTAKHDKFLPPTLLRIKICHEVIGKHLGLSIEKFYSNFKKDLKPSEELRVWELMSAVCLEYTKSKKFTKAQLNEISKVLLVLSMQNMTEDFLRSLKHINNENVHDIIVTWNNVLSFAD